MNNTFRAALLCCTCYIVLTLLSFIPPQKVFGIELRRANVLSDLITFPEDNRAENLELVIDVEEYEVDLDHVEEQTAKVATTEVTEVSNYEWHHEGEGDIAEVEAIEIETVDGKQRIKPLTIKPLLSGVELTPIEDFDTVEMSAMRRLYRKLLSPDSLVRVAVLGDSFIEADIVTCDLREALQNQYGGCGAGFAPMASPLTIYRKTIKTSHNGWTSYNVMQHRKTPQPYASNFTVSGWVSVPTNGASTTWISSSERQNIDSCQCVRLHFMSLNNSKVEVQLNGGERQTFEIEGGKILRQIELRNPDIRKVTMRVISGAEGFIGYGAHFEGESGVVVDNYSVRSNNGQAMFWTSPSVNAQIDKRLGGYDLVILQYGLNIMQSGVNNYRAYAEQVEKMIQYSKKCFPNAAIVVMGVSDRSMKINGSYSPMSEAESLTRYQRTAAEAQHVAFWCTHAAMQAQGGMSKFVANNWAAKDFTHINFAGGQRVAWALIDAINAGVEVERSKMVQKIEYAPLLDSAMIDRLNLEFVRPGVAPVEEIKTAN